MNNMWKVAFAGLGSIGTRHLRNLKEIMQKRGNFFSVDLIRNDRRDIPEEFHDIVRNVYTYEDNAEDDYDLIFVTNPTFRHYETIERYQWHTKALFIEKPVFDKDDLKLPEVNSECIFYVACPIRYKQVVQYVKKELNAEDVCSMILICSSYLPEWRRDQDYTKSYAAFGDKGGGVSLELIHEMDYLEYLFGEPEEIYNIRRHVSDLQVDCDDVSIYGVKLKHQVAQIYLDFLGRKDIREMLIFMRDDTVKVDLLANTVTYLRSGKTVKFSENRDDFQKAELSYFLRIVEGQVENTNDLARAMKTLRHTYGRL